MLRGRAAVAARSSTSSPASARPRASSPGSRGAAGRRHHRARARRPVRRGVRVPDQGHRAAALPAPAGLRAADGDHDRPGLPGPGHRHRAPGELDHPAPPARRRRDRRRHRERRPGADRTPRARSTTSSPWSPPAARPSGRRPRPTCAAARATTSASAGRSFPDADAQRHRLEAPRRPRSHGTPRVSGDHNPIHLYAADRQGARLPAPDRARHVDDGPLRRGAGEPDPRRRHGRRRVQAAGAAARARSRSGRPRWRTATRSRSPARRTARRTWWVGSIRPRSSERDVSARSRTGPGDLRLALLGRRRCPTHRERRASPGPRRPGR